MGKALDTAGLAAGRVALDDNAEEVAQQFFDANFGTVQRHGDRASRSTSSSTTPAASSPSPPRATTPDPLHAGLRPRHHDRLGAQRDPARDHRHGAGARPRQHRLDVGQRHYTRRCTSARRLDLVDIIYGDENEIDNLWVSLVPYVATVNIGTTPDRLARGDRPGAHRPRQLPGRIARLEGLRDGPGLSATTATTTPPSVAEVHLVLLRHDHAARPTTTGRRSRPASPTRTGRQRRPQHGARPNLGCGSPITPLTASKATIKAAIDAMGPVHRGGTTGNLGLTWGWRTLSPRWRGLWGDRRPAARLRHRLHGEGRGDPDRRQQPVPRPGHQHLEQLGPGLRLHRLRPHRDADRHAAPATPATGAPPGARSSTPA